MPADESHLRTQQLADSMREAAVLCRNGKITYANEAAASLLGASKKTLVGKSLPECLVQAEHEPPFLLEHPQSRAGKSRKQDTSAASASKTAGIATQDLDSGHVPHETLILLQGAPPRPAFISIENFPYPVLRCDSQLRYLEGNSAATSMAGSALAAACGLALTELGWPATVCRELEQALHSLPSKPLAQMLALTWNIGKTEHRFQVELIPEWGEHGLPVSVLLLLREPAGIGKETASRLRQAQHAYEKAQAASDARDAFLGWVSHALRTPLNGIQSWTHILETYVSASNNSPLAARAMQGIRNGVAQQLHLIEELLDVSRLMEGRVPLSRHGFPLNPIACAAVDKVRAAAEARQIDFDCRFLLEQDLIESDPCRVQQCMELLLSHAVHRSSLQGCIAISLVEANRHAIFRVRHGCSDERKGATANGLKPALKLEHHRHASRQEMDLLLARCLAELLDGSLKSEAAQADGEIIHTLSLPLHASPR